LRYRFASGRRPRRSRRGLTLIEIVIAFGVLLIAVMSALSSQITSMRLMTQSRETAVAMSDLQGCMERLLLVRADQIPIAGSDFEIDQPVDAYTDLHLTNEQIVPTYPGYVLGGTVPDPLPIVLTLTWNDPQGHARRLELSSMKTR
jgi:type II secretory pathway pseudopilin PulG